MVFVIVGYVTVAKFWNFLSPAVATATSRRAERSEEKAQKPVSLCYSGQTTEQVGKIYEQFYGKHYSKSQVRRLLDNAREDVTT